MASKKKVQNPAVMFNTLMYALSDAYHENAEEIRTFDNALMDLESAFEEVMSFLPE